MPYLTRYRRWLRQNSNKLRALISRPVKLQSQPVTSVFDVPAELPRRTAIRVAKGIGDQWLIFDCPCKAGHRVMLNINPDSRPAWRIINNKPLTLRPSVDEVTEHGRCHYLITKGKVTWV
jgi:hypothetical protein